MEQQNTQSSDPKHLHIVENKELSIGEALTPVIALVLMLFYNVFLYLAMMPLVEAINLFCF